MGNIDDLSDTLEKRAALCRENEHPYSTAFADGLQAAAAEVRHAAKVAPCGCGHEWTQHDTPGCMFGWDEIPVLNGCDCERAGRA